MSNISQEKQNNVIGLLENKFFRVEGAVSRSYYDEGSNW